MDLYLYAIYSCIGLNRVGLDGHSYLYLGEWRQLYFVNIEEVVTVSLMNLCLTTNWDNTSQNWVNREKQKIQNKMLADSIATVLSRKKLVKSNL